MKGHLLGQTAAHFLTQIGDQENQTIVVVHVGPSVRTMRLWNPQVYGMMVLINTAIVGVENISLGNSHNQVPLFGQLVKHQTPFGLNHPRPLRIGFNRPLVESLALIVLLLLCRIFQTHSILCQILLPFVITIQLA